MHDKHSPLRTISPDSWENIKILPWRHPSITSPEKYYEAAAAGLVKVRAYVNKRFSAGESPFAKGASLDELKCVHLLALGKVYTFGGMTRDENLIAEVFGKGASDPRDIKKEIECSNRQLISLLDPAVHPIHAYAFAYVRNVFIQPFTDGNKRVLREILAAQLFQLYPDKPLVTFFKREPYIEAMLAGYDGNLTPLADLICADLKIEKLPPFVVPREDIRPRKYTIRVS